MVKTFVLYSGSPLADALHAYDAEAALRALADPAPKEHPMTAVHSSPVVASPEAATLLRQVQALSGQVRDLATHLSDAESVVLDQQARIEALEARVETLEVPQPKPTRDEDNQRITRYLRETVPGVWMTPTAIAVNLDGTDAKAVAGRLDRLSRLPGTDIERTGGRGTGAHPLYRIAPPPTPESEG